MPPAVRKVTIAGRKSDKCDVICPVNTCDSLVVPKPRDHRRPLSDKLTATNFADGFDGIAGWGASNSNANSAAPDAFGDARHIISGAISTARVSDGISDGIALPL
ncbi:MAG: hypothetical protein WDO24_04865 [Pseudomonadota bacterium]